MQNPPDRVPRVVIPALIVFAIAFIVRFIVLLELQANDPTFYQPLIDSNWHHQWALEVASGKIFPDTVFFRAPLYPLILGLLYAVSGASIFFAKLFWITIGSISCVLLYRIGARTIGETIGKIAGVTMAFYGTIIFFDTQYLFPVFILFLNLTGFYLLLRYRAAMHLHWLLIAGLVFGLSAITRPNALFVVICLVVWLLFSESKVVRASRRLTRTVAFAICVVIPIIPVAAHNYSVSGDFIPVSNQGGINLYLGNNGMADGLVVSLPDVGRDQQIAWHEFVDLTDSIAIANSGRDLSPAEISSYWSERAIDWVESDFAGFVSLTLKKVYYFFAGYEVSNNSDIYGFRSNSTLLSILIFDAGVKFPYGLLIPMAIIGIAATGSRWRQLLPLHLMIWPYAVSVIVFFVTARYRLPVVPFLTLFAAAGAVWLIDTIRKRSLGLNLIPVVVALALAVLLNVRMFDLTKGNPSVYNYHRAAAYQLLGDDNNAIMELRKALSQDPFNVDGLLRLGRLEVATGANDNAISTFKRVLEMQPNNVGVNSELARLYYMNGDFDASRDYYDKILTETSTDPRILSGLADLLMASNQADSAEVLIRRAIDLSDVRSMYANQLGSLFAETGRLDSAYKYFSVAIKDDPDFVAARVNLTNVKLATGDTLAAIGEYESILEDHPNMTGVAYNLAAVLYFRGEFERSRRYAEWALKIDPSYGPAQNLIKVLDNQVE